MKNNKAFTLVELLGTITIISVLAIIVLPIVDKSLEESRNNLFSVQINKIINATKDWATKNISSLPEEEGNVITITIGQLKQSGFLSLDIRNPKTKKLFPNDMLVTIKRAMNGYEYNVNLESGTEYFDEEINPNSPFIILNGNSLEYIELNSTYNDSGVIAKNSSGDDITDNVTIQIKEGDTEVSKVLTDDFRSYTIHYTVTDNEITSKSIRTVIVRDSTPPELIIPSNVVISPSEVINFDLLEGVSATDNSGKDVSIEVESQLSNIIGKYVVTYNAKDQSNNTTTKKRLIRVETKYIASDLNGAVPELDEGMIPIKWDGSKWVKASTSEKWYDYSNKEWANVVLVNNVTRNNYINASAGTTINESDVLAYLVWIPRYKYKLFNVDATVIPIATVEVIFESNTSSKSNGTMNDTYLTHPAFTFGNTELNGFWVGKFETTGTASTPTIKPNITSLRSQNISTQFTTAQLLNNLTTYGITTSNDSHMMKNMEWGAVALLSQSKHGKNSEIWMNPSSTFITGCGGTSATSSSAGCSYAYSTSNGQQSSTTGNVYGIYDMSGGSNEYVMGATYNSNNTTINILSSGFNQTTIDNASMSKYIDKYIYGTTRDDQAAYNRRILGDATGEIRGWHDDYMLMPDSALPWISRGGLSYLGSGAGIFAFASGNGGSTDTTATFRVVISSK